MNEEFNNYNQNNNTNNQPINNNQTINNTYDQQNNLNVNGQINSQQYSNVQTQNENNSNMNFDNSYQQPFNSDVNSQNIDKNPKKKSKTGIIVLVIAIILIIVIVAIILVSKSGSKNEISESNNATSTNTDTNKSTNGKYVIYLNDMKIILGETTMDYIVQNTNLKVVKDSTTHGTCGSSSCTIKEGDSREIVLSDGVNNITIESYFGYPNKSKRLATLNRTDDPAFDTSTGTKLVFVDNAIGKNINIGDSFTEDEYYDIYKNTGTCLSSSGMIQCSQTKLYANDYFVYWLDSNYKIINMSANLLNY